MFPDWGSLTYLNGSAGCKCLMDLGIQQRVHDFGDPIGETGATGDAQIDRGYG